MNYIHLLVQYCDIQIIFQKSRPIQFHLSSILFEVRLMVVYLLYCGEI